MNIGVILSAGDSKRFGGYMNKQYLKLNGTEVVAYSIKAMRASKAIDEVMLVVDREEYESRYIAEKYKVRCIVGGETRNRSIYNALCFIRENYSCENVVFHDSVRPLIPAKKFDEIFENLQGIFRKAVSCRPAPRHPVRRVFPEFCGKGSGDTERRDSPSGFFVKHVARAAVFQDRA